MSINDHQLKNITKRLVLEQEVYEVLVSHLKKTKIQKINIRDTLCEQNQPCKKCFYLLEGSVNLITTLTNGQKAIISQINAEQFLNLEICSNYFRNKYTITVSSPFIKYIALEQKDAQIIISQLKEQIQRTMEFREKEKIKKNKKAEEKTLKQNLEKQIKKLQLPNVNYKVFKRNPSLIIPTVNIDTQRHSEHLPQFPASLRKSLGQSRSLKQVKKKVDFPQNIEDSNMKVVQQKLLDHYHEYQDRLGQNKIERLKSERSISLGQKQSKSINYSRNEKLFKEQLKNIVKRKLIFERKHFKVLKKLNNRDNQVQNSKNALQLRYSEKQLNPLDNYFDI